MDNFDFKTDLFTSITLTLNTESEEEKPARSRWRAETKLESMAESNFLQSVDDDEAERMFFFYSTQ